MKNFIAISLCLSSLLIASEPLSIDNLVEMSLENSPEIQKYRLEYKASRYRVDYVKGSYLPRLDVIAGASANEVTMQDRPANKFNLISGNIHASQLVYDFGKTMGKIDAFKDSSSAYSAILQQQISAKVLEVKYRYYEVLKRDSYILVQEKNVELSQMQLDRSQQYYEKGIRTVVDVSNAKVILTRAKLALKNAEYAKQLADIQLIKAVGIVTLKRKFDLVKIEVPLPFPSKSIQNLDLDTDELIAFAKENRYQLKVQKHQIDTQEKLITSSKGDYYPHIFLDVDYMKTNPSKTLLQGLYPVENLKAGVNLRWNLFAGLQTDAMVEESKVNLQKSRANMQDVELAIINEVVASYINLLQSKDAMILSEELLQTSKLKFEQIQRLYQNDIADYLEMQQAQQDFIQAMTDLSNSYYSYFIAMARMDFAIGR